MSPTGHGPETTAFLAERYWPGIDAASAGLAVHRLGDEIDRLSEEGSSTTAITCTFVPREQAVLCVVRAASAEVVADLGRRAGVPFDRIVEAVVFLPADPAALHGRER
jgi:hypothetical protein